MITHALTATDAYAVSLVLRAIDGVPDVDLAGSISVFRSDRHIGYLVLDGDADAVFTQEEPRKDR